jgi:hypothetical protein
MGATILFTVADSVIWLFVARGVQASRPAPPSVRPARRCLTFTPAAIRPASG